MREIKFRVWDAEEKEMVILEKSGLQYFDFEGGYSLGFTVDGYSGFWAHEQYEKASKKASGFQIMQFTGLKDKNGKEIYEGDICKTYTVDLGNLKEQVVFEDGSFLFKHHHALSVELRGFKTDYIEIIGNIHENPELL